MLEIRMIRATLVLTSVVLSVAPFATATTTVEYGTPGQLSSTVQGPDSFSFNSLPVGVNTTVVWQGVGTFNGLTVMNSDQWGGANGGKYAFAGTVSGSPTPVSTTLTFNQGASYFAFLWNAADPYNSFTLKSGNTVVATLNNANLISALGGCSGGTVSAYCGNPTNGLDRGELFVYVQFIADANTKFTEADWNNQAFSNFEFENLAYADDPVSVNPEPRSWALLGLGLLIGVGTWRVKRNRRSVQL
ncbi:MAG: PEP-CTERM sorting domain-containing protein [Acidobacteriaceae bacterium]|nr:PEP-CTERM sorting domain-containing protein [Acidobacteriaceae bacterium]